MSALVQKITFAEMRAAGVRGVLIYCSDYRCSHSTSLYAGRWGDDIRLSDIEPAFVCAVCGRRGADVRPDWESLQPRPKRQPKALIYYAVWRHQRSYESPQWTGE